MLRHPNVAYRKVEVMSTRSLPASATTTTAELPRKRGSLARALGLALAPMLLFVSVPVGLAGGFALAWLLLAASLVLITLDAALFGSARA